MYSSKDSFDLSPATPNNHDSGSKGCRLSVASGFILTFLAFAIAVGVGVIVHFAATNNKDVICQCNCGTTASPSSGDNNVPQVCSILAKANFQPLCGLCSMDTTNKPPMTTIMNATKMATTVATTTTTTQKPPVIDIRLPTSLKPTHYNLRLRPEIYSNEPKNFTFTGDVEIFIKCLSETNNITLHMKEMELTTDPVVSSTAAGAPTYKSYTEDKERQFLIVQLTGPLTVGQMYSLHLKFKGKMADDLLGLYKSYYSTGNKTVHLAFTTFEPASARKAFPCFDEPAMKATFNVSLDRKTDSNIMTLSNMPLMNSVQLTDGFTRDNFETTVVMPTYLVAVAFTDFVEKTNYTSRGTKIRVYSQPDRINNTDLALRLNVELTEAFESYFGINYSLPKLDSIAAPHFLAGAMEHWGLVTYIEFALYYTPGQTSTKNYDYTHVIVAHELAHQWCGNLVSPEWWDDLWLNEGFATYFSYLGLDMIKPTWKTTEYYIVYYNHKVMEIDGYETSHPVHRNVNVNTIAGVWQLFDAITYNKGGAVIRMMRFFLGEDTFRFGMQEYLKSKEYGAANHNDLYAPLQNRANRDGLNISMETIMDTWIEQMNYPVVNVTYDANSGKVTIHQQRFLYTCATNQAKCEDSRVKAELHCATMEYNFHLMEVRVQSSCALTSCNCALTSLNYILTSKRQTSEDKGKFHSYMWEIPFTYATSVQPDFNPTFKNITWMSKMERSKEFMGKGLPNSADGWIVGNIRQYGYFRVTYSQENWDALQRQLMKDHTVFHVLNRAQLIDDSWALSRAGMLNIVTPLKMMNYLKNETEYTPWLAAQSDIQSIDAILEPTKIYGKFEAYIVSMVKSHFAVLNIKNTEHLSVQKRMFSALIFDMACKYFIQACEDQALQMFTDWRVNGKLIPPDVKATVWCTAVREGGETEWNYMYQIYKTSPMDAAQALTAMGCTRRHWLQRRLLDYSIMADKIKKEHLQAAILAVVTNPDGFHQAWAFLMANWKFLVTTYKVDISILNNIFTEITRALSTDNDIQQVMFWKEHIHPADTTQLPAFTTAVARIQANKVWFATNYQILEDWLDSLI